MIFEMPVIRLDRYFRLQPIELSPTVKRIQVQLLFSASKLGINSNFDQMLGVIFTSCDSLILF